MSGSSLSRENTISFTHEDKLNNPLERIKTAGSVSIPPELFEQLYLAPFGRVKGELRQPFGNPTPTALGGFLLCSTPMSMVLLGWQNAGGLGAANVGAFFYLGGLLLILGGVGEWILGNTFPATVFSLFGGFWFTFGATLVPSYNAYGAYSPDPTKPAEGMNATFFATFSFFLVAMTILSAILCVASVRTNVCLFTIFVIIVPTFASLAGSFFSLAHDHVASATKLQHVGGALLFTLSLLGWYILAAMILASVDFPILLPLGDLSTVIKGSSDQNKKKSGSPVAAPK